MSAARTSRSLARLALALLVAAAPGRAQERGRPLPTADRVPKLVVFITIDQFRGDYLGRFRGQLTGGLARLAREGAFFTNAFQDHATTETAPGHASTMSGRFPSHTGIVRNAEGVQDPQSPYLGAPNRFASPFRFRGGTLIDWMRIKDPETRALSVARKDRAAILPLGRAQQSAFWYDPSSGRFTTSNYYADTLPTWLAQFNAQRLPARYAGRAWTLLLDSTKYPEPDSVAIEAGGRSVVFPHVLSVDTARAINLIQEYPFMDEVTLAAALAGVRALDLGGGESTDLLAISLSTTDAIGHKYGPDSRELHDQVLRVDRMLGSFLDSLFTLRGPERVVIALTADHGVASAPELDVARRHTPSYRVDLSSIGPVFQRALVPRGVPPEAFVFDDAMLCVDRDAFRRAHVSADSVIDAFAAAVRATAGVARVDRVSRLAADSARDPIARRWLHSIPAELPVELVVTLAPNSVWGDYATGIHGSPYDYDAHVPVLFWGAPFRAGRYDDFARVVDMAPTLAWVTATRVAEPVDGRVLWKALR